MIWLYIILFLILIGGCIAWAVWKAPSDVDLWEKNRNNTNKWADKLSAHY